MQAAHHDTKPELPGNHGQFGESVTTEAYKPLRATQRVPVRPVVPRRGTTSAGKDRMDPASASRTG